jgi:acyl-CoA dehydrogenase
VIAALRKEVRAFADAHAPAHWELEEAESARRALQELGEAGLLEWCVPARDGGKASDLVAQDTVSVRVLVAIRRELAYSSAMLDIMFVMQGLGSFAIAQAGSEEQRRKYLPDVARGRSVAAFALTEPEAGSSLTDVASAAVPTSSGYLLNGHKTFISNAPMADFFTVLARTAGEPGDKQELSMFLVPRSTRGLEVRPFEVLAPHPIGELLFHDVALTPDMLLGELGDGLTIALGVLGRFRTSVAAAACGFSRRALDESIAHLKRRRQFGRPLASFQGLRFDVAEMDTRLRAGELLVAEAASAVDNGAQATREVARAKLFATENASWICDRAVQHFGGLGVKRGEVVERLFRDVRALRIYEGASEVQKLILAKSLFDG